MDDVALVQWRIGPPLDLSVLPPAVYFSDFPPAPGETGGQYFRRVTPSVLMAHAKQVQAARPKWWQFWRAPNPRDSSQP